MEHAQDGEACRSARGPVGLPACLAFCMVCAWGLAGAGAARAQSAESPAPGYAEPAITDLVTDLGDELSDEPTRPSLIDVFLRSSAGPLQPDLWRPLGIDTLFSEGWDEQYAPVPISGTDIPPRQTWINSADGAFYRLFVFSFGYAGGVPGNSSIYNGSSFLFTPLSRRLEIGWFFPFVVSSPNLLTPHNTRDVTGVGDLTIAPRVLLAEGLHYTVTSNLYVRLPTGSIQNGNGAASLSPDVEFWSNPVDRWVVRGAIGVTVPTNITPGRLPYLALDPFTGFNASPSAFTSFDSRLAIGQYITPTTGRFLGDFVYYAAANFHTALSGGHATYFSLTPGIRFDVGNYWYFLAGVEVPMVGPLPFQAQGIFQIIKNF